MNANMDPVFEHYKQLGFTEHDVMVILVMDHLAKQDNRLITAELLSLKMSLTLEQIDQIMVKLLQRQLLEFVTVDGKTSTSLKPLKQLLYKRFQQHVMHQTQELNLTEQASIFQTIERGFGRTLSPLEISRIQDWLNYGYTAALIETSLMEAISKQKKSIRYIDKLLQKQTMKENFEQEGTVLVGGESKDIQKTLSELTEKLEDEAKRR
jgi:DNA replication protein